MAQLLKENLGYCVLNKKTPLFHKIVANTMQYKYQEVSYNFLPNLGTDYLSRGMVKLTVVLIQTVRNTPLS